MQVTYNDSVDQFLSDIRTINLLTKDDGKSFNKD